ncbi:MAG: B12-binding domain-containing radical SAM protein [Deltaproteobacteria bacterium]
MTPNTAGGPGDRVLLIMFAPYRTVQTQIAALSAFLKQEGCAVRYLEVPIFTAETFAKHIPEIARVLESFRPRIVGFSAYDMNQEYITACADFVKRQDADILTIAGGHAASLAPEDYLGRPGVDAVVVGEGEAVLRDILAHLRHRRPLAGIPGLCTRGGEKPVVCLPPRPLERDLDRLPFPDRGIVAEQQREIDYLPVFAGKGCPYGCTYCSNASIRALYPNPGLYVRYRSPENILEEIAEGRRRFSFRSVYFYDDIFALDVEWLKTFARLYRQRFPDLPYMCLLNPRLANDETRLRLLADSGCEAVFLGVESGSEGYRQKVLGRHMTNASLLAAARSIGKFGMRVNIFLMVGLPDETVGDMARTVLLNYRMRPDGAQTTIFFPIKNTALYRYCAEKGLIDEEKRKKLLIYSYDTCLRVGLLKRFLIICFKWINSASPVITHLRLDLVLRFLRIQFRKYVTKTISYR